MRVRPILASDARMVGELVKSDWSDSTYAATSRWALDAALAGRGEDAEGLVAVDDASPMVAGLIVFGPVAGATGAARVLGVAVPPDARARNVADALCAAMLATLRAGGTRLVVAELPDDPAAAATRAVLQRAGFHEAGRVADYFRDGVALFLLRRDLGDR